MGTDQFGPNAPRRDAGARPAADCYLGLLLLPGPAGEPEAGTVLIVTPAALLHPDVPSRLAAWSMSCSPATLNASRESWCLYDLTVELRAWPPDTWTAIGIDPEQVAQAVIGCWRDGEVTGLQVDDLELRRGALAYPASHDSHVRGQLRGRLTARLGCAYQRCCIPPAAAAPRPVPLAVTPGPRHGGMRRAVRRCPNAAAWISRSAGHPRADGIASFEQTLPHMAPSAGDRGAAEGAKASSWAWCWAASGEGCRQTGLGPLPATTARSRRSLPEAALTAVATRLAPNLPRCTGVPVSRPDA